jgi:biotin synthase
MPAESQTKRVGTGVIWSDLARQVMEGKPITREQALRILQSPAAELLSVLDAAFAIRRNYFGFQMRLHVLRNARSGGCTEDCGYCSQSARASKGAAPGYPLQSRAEIVSGAHDAHKMKAIRYCVVSSGRTLSNPDLDEICDTIRQIKAEVPIQVCLSMGLLTPAQASQLKAAGLDRYNHNLETSEQHFPHLCTTHSYGDRVSTARIVKAAGLELCCGGLLGAAETLEDRVDLAFALKAVSADSIPINFLDPRPGTPFQAYSRLNPCDALRALAMFRFVHPTTEIRIAGGREACLGPMQALSLYAANSMFTEGYLTTSGQGYATDMALLTAAGFEVGELTQA